LKALNKAVEPRKSKTIKANIAASLNFQDIAQK
jgi:hypothetical protein